MPFHSLLPKLHKHKQAKKRRKHKIVPWLESPLHGADEEELVFAQRHEANPLELFFDLFFVANLATFTTYHTITDSKALYSYIGFFAIIWSTWFQVTLHDVRFARDSIYERVCKTIQFVVFVGFALVGSKFKPSRTAESNTNFRILCYTLVISRVLFAIQYAIVLICTFVQKGFSKLHLPLGLNTLVYIIGAAIFAGMTPAFAKTSKIHTSIYWVWWIVLLLEGIFTIGISCIWRMLSFKKTHLIERMGLLTLIVIGEGAIGVTKTISKLMGKYGLDPEGSGLVLCIILVLIFIWMLYFDNSPHGHYGTVRQQIWSLLHFPLHLAIVGVVEGSQQIALARYIVKAINKLDKSIIQACLVDNLDGKALVEKLATTIDYFQLDYKLESSIYVANVTYDLEFVYNTTGICASENLDPSFYQTSMYPEPLLWLFYDTSSAIYASLGMKLPANQPAIDVAIESWKVIYVYYFASVALLLFCLGAFLVVTRRNHKADLFDWVGTTTRVIGFVASFALMIMGVSHRIWLYDYLSTPGIIPTVLIIMLVIIIFDRLAGGIANWRLRKSGEPYDDESAHAHHDHDGHGKPEATHQVETKGMLRPVVETYTSYQSQTSSSHVSQHMSSDGDVHRRSQAYPMQDVHLASQTPTPAPPGYEGHQVGAGTGYIPVNNGYGYA